MYRASFHTRTRCTPTCVSKTQAYFTVESALMTMTSRPESPRGRWHHGSSKGVIDEIFLICTLESPSALMVMVPLPWWRYVRSEWHEFCMRIAYLASRTYH